MGNVLRDWITAVKASIPPRTSHEGRVQHWVLGICNAGTCEHGQPGGIRFTMSAGDVLVIRPGVSQQWITKGGEDWQVVSCIFNPRPHWLPWLELPQVAPGFLRLRLSGRDWREARRYFERACSASSSGQEEAQDLTAHAVEGALLICMRALLKKVDDCDSRVRLALELQTADFSRALGMAELARRCGLSIPHLQRLYRAQIGSTPAAYLERMRHQRASQLLRLTDLPVKAVSRSVGFKDQQYFSSWFKRISGESPSTHRAKA